MDFTEKEGLLFYASGGSFRADYAAGEPEATFCKEVSVVKDESGNPMFECGDYQALAWKAPGNIYAERGTLSFFWRSRYPVGPTEFPVFRVGFEDHTSWDATWLRIDYNGHGFDAMITDRNLSRARVSWRADAFPPPRQWIHLAVCWDQAYGIRLYVDGKLAGEEYRPAVYDTALNQFGPHSRSVSNWSVINDYNFIRGGDIRELVIYDRMLSAENVARLSRMECPAGLSDMDGACGISEEEKKSLWKKANGLENKPPYIHSVTSVRKVEIHDAFDQKRWYWKACDGIRETTWPGVYNRSRLKGRNDYFQLPDWDCYSVSGKTIAFTMPREKYNWVEISGSAHGPLEFYDDDNSEIKPEQLFVRKSEAERTVHPFKEHFGGKLVFTNDEIEEPIGDFSAFYVKDGEAPAGSRREAFCLAPVSGGLEGREAELVAFVAGRFPEAEKNLCLAVKENEVSWTEKSGKNPGNRYPSYQLLIPYTEDSSVGLDGVEILIPEDQKLQGCSFSVQIKDPLWYFRNLMQFTFRVDGKGNRIWMDTRDRILPEHKCLYLTVACDDFDFTMEDMLRWKVELVYKSGQEAKKEHCLDRFTQVRDLYGHLVEESPKTPAYNMFNRFVGDIDDLMRVDPDHIPGQYYRYEKELLLRGKTKFPGLKQKKNPEDAAMYRPDFQTGKVPAGIPAWAYKQVEYLKRYKNVVNWYIDHRQIENGEFGGGLSDDGDFTSLWVGLALMGCNPEKVIDSMERCNDAFYEQGMFTNGLCSIQADELHSAEEGLISLNQCCMADYGNPKFLERAMENARAGFWITGINQAGHRHFKSTYFTGSKMATEHPWGYQEPLSALALSPSWYVARFNRNQKVLQLLTELADGLAAHYDPQEKMIYGHIRYCDDAAFKVYSKDRARGHIFTLYPAYRLTGNEKYYEILDDKYKEIDISYVERSNEYNEKSAGHVDKDAVAAEYEERCFAAGVREYYNTDGSPWIDRVEVRYQEIQYDRLAGVGHERRYVVYPRNRVSWRFERETDDERLAILSPVALDDQIKLIVCNISVSDVHARLLGGEMTPGLWSYELGVDQNGDDKAEEILETGEQIWIRGDAVSLTFPAGKTCVLNLRLKKAMPEVTERCDLGISKADIRMYPHGLNVTVHSLGHINSPEAQIALRDPSGEIVRLEAIPPMEAPTDLYPRTWEVIFNVYDIDDLSGYVVEIDPDHELEEITRENNQVVLRKDMLKMNGRQRLEEN